MFHLVVANIPNPELQNYTFPNTLDIKDGNRGPPRINKKRILVLVFTYIFKIETR